jgi:hypothetical protein
MISLVLCFLLTSLPFQVASAQDTSAPFSLAIESTTSVVHAGGEVSVRVTLTNTTNHEITFVDRNRDCDYVSQVSFADGKKTNETEYKQQLNCKYEMQYGRWIFIKLKPHESRVDELAISKLFDMSHPAIYSVQVLREKPLALGKGQVKSNVITITVI